MSTDPCSWPVVQHISTINLIIIIIYLRGMLAESLSISTKFNWTDQKLENKNIKTLITLALYCSSYRASSQMGIFFKSGIKRKNMIFVQTSTSTLFQKCSQPIQTHPIHLHWLCCCKQEAHCILCGWLHTYRKYYEWFLL